MFGHFQIRIISTEDNYFLNYKNINQQKAQNERGRFLKHKTYGL